MLIIGVVFFGIFTLLAGPLAEKYGRRKTLIWVSLGIVVFGFLLGSLLFGGGFAGTMAHLIIGFTLMGLTFGPMGAILPELFPTNVRYTGSAIAYNLSSILGASVAPFIAVALWQAGGREHLPGGRVPECSCGADPDRPAAEQGDARTWTTRTSPADWSAGHTGGPAAVCRGPSFRSG